MVYFHKVPLPGMYMFTGEGVCILVFPLSPDLTPPVESQSQFGEPVPPISFVQDIICTCHNTPPEVLFMSVKAFKLVMSKNNYWSAFEKRAHFVLRPNECL